MSVGRLTRFIVVAGGLSLWASGAAAAAAPPENLVGTAAIAGDRPLAGAKVRFFDHAGRDITASVFGQAPLAKCPASFQPGPGCTGRSGSFIVIRKKLLVAREVSVTGGMTGIMRDEPFKGTLRRYVAGASSWGEPSVTFLTSVVAAARTQDKAQSFTLIGNRVRRMVGLPSTFRLGIDGANSEKTVSGSTVLNKASSVGGFNAYVRQLAAKALAGERGVDLKSSGFSVAPAIFASALSRIFSIGTSVVQGGQTAACIDVLSYVTGEATAWLPRQLTDGCPTKREEIDAIRQDLTDISTTLADTRTKMAAQYDSLVGKLEIATTETQCQGAKNSYTTLSSSISSDIANSEYLQGLVKSLPDYTPGSKASKRTLASINTYGAQMEIAPTRLYNALRNDGSRPGLLYLAWERIRACSVSAGYPVIDQRASTAFRTVVEYWVALLKTINEQVATYWIANYDREDPTDVRATAKRIGQLELMIKELRGYVPPILPVGVAYDPVNGRMWAKPQPLLLRDEGIPAGDTWRVVTRPPAGEGPNYDWSTRPRLDYAGYVDWRVPTAVQLQQLLRLTPPSDDHWSHLAKVSPEADGGIFPASVNSYSVRDRQPWVPLRTQAFPSWSASSGGLALFYETFQGWQWQNQVKPVPAFLTADYQTATAVVHRPCQPLISEWKPLSGNAAWGGYRYVPLDRWVDDRTKNVWRVNRAGTAQWEPCPGREASFRFSSTYMPAWNRDNNFDAGDRPGVNASGTGWTRGWMPFAYYTPAGDPGMLSLPTRVAGPSERPDATDSVLPSVSQLQAKVPDTVYQ